ncbi:MFS transporter [Peribacillus alkalitolerans]|uniref:MFS transporter n=1 Tax=Peribacillus alkalitolerans TaxID=1550385 RepID=UPI0013D1C5B6|nr:MFS transporter [Peribacillus alkalitolerans]
MLMEWRHQIQSYNQNIKWILLGNFFIQIGFGIFMVIYNFYIRTLGFEDVVNGKVVSMASLATALLLVPAGLLADKKGRKNILIIGLILTGIFTIGRSIVETESSLLLFAFLAGGTSAFLQVSMIPILSDNSNPSQRIHLFSIHFSLMTLANVIGNVSGGLLTDLFLQFTSNLHSIRTTLLIGSAIYLLAIWPLMKIKEAKEKEVGNGIEVIGKKEKKAPLYFILLFAGSQLIIGIGAGLVIPYLNLYFADRFHAPNSIIGIIISLGQAATAIAMFIGPAVVKRVGEVKAVVLLQLLSLPFLLLTAYTEHLVVAAIAFLFRQALMNAGNPIQMSLMMSLVPANSKGLASSANQMAFNLGWAFMGPVSTSIVMSYGVYWGYATVFTITSMIYLMGTCYFFFICKSMLPNKKEKVAISQV